ncbi:hypothetical protein [Limnochorda pilosa]|uniref:Uncharacterized protein n=1 Tax=Limnochorda pilosa TaxID=1555112 RepID=A0A0K2SIT7_LIMPI|nr:hypothetical protein [Limnochorda pilosa]BAS27023.1 hypothetical protein LIP_1166 [Limnochorda pilosa]
MRMESETYRMAVSRHFDALREKDDGRDEEQQALERMALEPRQTREFLKNLDGQPPEVQRHFYAYLLARGKTDAFFADMERHLRHRFYEAREEIKAVLATLTQEPEVLPGLFRLIRQTDEGWLAGELIHLCLSFAPEHLAGAVEQALGSRDYLLQCLGIYLAGQSADPLLADVLIGFYRKPEGEKLDRLESKSRDALLEASAKLPPSVLRGWLSDSNARVRRVGVEAARSRKALETAADLVRLVLVDAKTRDEAAAALLVLEEAGLRLTPGGEGAEGVAQLLGQARRDAMEKVIKGLARQGGDAVRQVALKLIDFVASQDLLFQARRMAVEDRVPAVQKGALDLLLARDRKLLLDALVHLAEARGTLAPDLRARVGEIVEQALTPDEREELRRRVEEKRHRRDRALERYSADVEWWRDED